MPGPRIEATPHVSPDRTERLWYAGVAVSVLLHIGVVGVLAGILSVVATPKAPPGLDTRWTSAADDFSAPVERLERIEPDAGPAARPELAAASAPSDRLPPLDFGLPLPAAELPSDFFLHDAPVGDLLAEVGAAGSSRGDGNAGAGNGDGDGDGPGTFFGIQAEGKRFVYVVDRSGSMNSPHAGPGHTRFGRVKLELAKSIGGLAAESEFFVIFFDQNPLAMPAAGMQPALPPIQSHYLQWVAKLRAEGETDPRAALVLAFALQPDAIFFLTDADFSAAIKKELLAVRQDRIAVHTFAFGNRRGHNVLKTLAENNRGTFAFIP
ncbi:MAG: hypothetical protein WD069_18300 [Planctomycetales bacterium]